MSDDDTIFALSSGALPSGVAVVRLSGPASRLLLETVAGPLPAPRRAVLRRIRDGAGETIDRGLVLWLPEPESFSGEDMGEIHVHGGRAVVAALAATLRAVGARPAEAGEFARRAFLAGRMDLTEAEGLADLIAAETEAQRRQAVRQAGGALRRRYEGWRADLVRIRALIEAELDFSEEEDVPGAVADVALAEAAVLLQAIVAHLADGRRGERLRQGLEVVLMGPPNAGKSSLLNALCGRDAAIVSSEPGTTRDLVEVAMDLGGFPVTIVDSAGLRAAQSEVEREGIRRALQRGEGADLVLLLEASDSGAEHAIPELPAVPLLRVRTKIDLIDSPPEELAAETDSLAVSAVTGVGLDLLERRLAAAAEAIVGRGEDIVLTRERHRAALTEARYEIEAAVTTELLPLELRAESLRRAGDAIGRITGRVDVEDLLDVIFRQFCIGK